MKKKDGKTLQQPDLLAPAGSWETMRAAISAGADAVYFGVDQLNMRARAARPFQPEDLDRIAGLCREKRVRSCLALNTLVYDEETDQLQAICRAAKQAGISAVIATDMAAVQAARDCELPVHLSTQVNISNAGAVRFFSAYADVMVLARELSLDQIRSICSTIQKDNICGPGGKPVRIELFVHGALCVAISGKCHMSLSLTGHSANRGDCFQICRRTYEVTDTETGQSLHLSNRFVMSPRDLCTIGMIDRIIDAGVSVFKIEGRARPADYVFHTTRVYRQAIDACLEGSYTRKKIDSWSEELKSVFNRGFWENGYYQGRSAGEWSGSYGSLATLQKTCIGKVMNYYGKSRIAHVMLQHDSLSENETIAISGPTTGYIEFSLKSLYSGDVPAKKASKGEEITFSCEEKVRPNDTVYVIRKRTDWQS
ncbi:U32 family peptidase [bacterium]|nr:U32 family peptidase [bacterium]